MPRILIAVLAMTVVFRAGAALAGSNDDAKIALHLQAHAVKGICSVYAPTDIPCSQFTTSGQVTPRYEIYVIAVNGDVTFGIGGAAFGVDYDGTLFSGLEVLGWSLCADTEFSVGSWPDPGSGNRVLFDVPNCQTSTVPGYESEGAFAVLGALYVYAYSPDSLEIVPVPDLAIVDCFGVESAIPACQTGSVKFSASGDLAGHNPCVDECEPPPVDCTDPLDQFAYPTGSQAINIGSDFGFELGQSFVPTVDEIPGVRIFFADNTTTDKQTPVRVSVWQSSSPDFTSGTLVGSIVQDTPEGPGADTGVGLAHQSSATFVFSPPLDVTPGETYVVQVAEDQSPSDTDLSWRKGESYPDGVAIKDGGAVFLGDFAFQTTKSTCLELSFDIQPGSCPNPLGINKRGVIPVAILGTEDFDVRDVDVSSLLMEGVPPKRSNLEDVGTPFSGDLCGCNDEGPDGIEDLTLKFMAPPIIEGLAPVIHGEQRELTLTGNLLDGSSFETSDCVVLRGGPKDAFAPAPGIEPEDPNPAPGDETESQGASFLLSDSHPNHRIQQITYGLATDSEVRLRVYDVTGRLLEELVRGSRIRGEHTHLWDTAHLPSGVYFYRLEAGGQAITRKTVLVR